LIIDDAFFVPLILNRERIAQLIEHPRNPGGRLTPGIQPMVALLRLPVSLLEWWL
jgi:hypothetical protein